MTLPKFNHPTFRIEVPSTGKEEIFRPFLVKEEKLLLIAQQSSEDADILRSLTHIIANCAIEPDFDATSLATFDIEYIFLKLRAVSVNNIVDLQYMDSEDEKIYEFKVNLDEVQIQRDPNNTTTITNDDGSGLVMKYPRASIADGLDTTDPLEAGYHTIMNCIDKIFTSEEVFNAAEYSKEELQDFIDHLDLKTSEKIKDFFSTLPKMYHKIEYENSKGSKRVIELKSLRDFFTWG